MAVELSVVIPCYGHGTELVECLHSLLSQQTNLNFEIIVVDSSPNPSIGKMRNMRSFRLIHSEKRLSPGAARNIGAQDALGNCIAFIDSDCIASTRWINKAWCSIQDGHEIIGGPILDMKPAHFIAWVDNRCQFADFQSGRPQGVIDHIPSCNMIISKEAWQKLGGFPETTITGEDVQLTSKAKELGLSILFNPVLSIQHRGRKTLPDFLSHQQILGYHRGLLGLFVTKSLQIIGQNPLLAWLVVLRRLIYISVRTFQYDKRGVPRFLFSLPLIIFGLIAWTIGFYRGIKHRMLEI